MKKMIIAAGTGFLGQVLANHFKNKFEIIILTRGKSDFKNGFKLVNWNAKSFSGWESELEDAYALINLTGRSVDCRYTEGNKKIIYDSRIDSTKILNEAVMLCKNPPKHWLNSSTSTIYRHSEDKQMTEKNGEIGDDFSMNIAKAWEKEFFSTNTSRTIKTALRTSIVLGKSGGAFVPIKKLAQFGMGGKQGNGKQFISWIHEKDFARSVEFIIENEMTGIVNLVSPKPIRNASFMQILQSEMKMLIAIPTPQMILRFGALLIGTEPELVLKSRNVIPERLLENGFIFEFETLEKAFKNLLAK